MALDDLIQRDLGKDEFSVDPKDYYPAAWNEASFEGKVYAIAALAGALIGAGAFGSLYPRLQAPLAKRFQGRAKVVAEPEMNAVDCRIGWQYGEAVRNIDHLWEQIEATIHRYFTAPAGEMTTPLNNPTESPKGAEIDE